LKKRVKTREFEMLEKGPKQGNLLETPILEFADRNHALIILAGKIDWASLEEIFAEVYSWKMGAPAKSVRLMVGLHFLKYMHNFSDESIIEHWVENPYWQYFCGEEYFQKKFPIHPTTMTKWRNRLKGRHLDKLLEETIATGLTLKVLTKRSFEHVNVDTTVMEKNVSFPTDGKLLYKSIQHINSFARDHGLKLKQTFERVGKERLLMIQRYAHSRKMKKSRRELRKLKTNLNQLIRMVTKQVKGKAAKSFAVIKETAERLLGQTRTTKNKIYSLHEPHVECISKGKAHKRYEFGCKVGFVTTSKEGFVLSAKAFHGNPYDGHTLNENLSHAEKIVEGKGAIKEAFADRGYRGHGYAGETKVHIVKNIGKQKQPLKKWMKRRSVVEADIGFMKRENRLGCNYLKGITGDQTNAAFAAIGKNMRILLREISFLFFLPEILPAIHLFFTAGTIFKTIFPKKQCFFLKISLP